MSEELRKVLRGWFVHPFEPTRAAGELAMSGDAEGVAHLYKRVRKSFALDRPMAVEFLGELKTPEARAELLKILDTPKDLARGTAARALGLHGGDDVKAKLLALLGDATVSENFKLDVAEGLLRLGERSAVQALRLDDATEQSELEKMLAEYA